jgi:hypothetical protein
VKDLSKKIMRSNYENEVSFALMMELLFSLRSKLFFETLKGLLKRVRLLLYI